MNAPIKALAPWFGAKRAMASDIIPLLGDHQSYIEPFCGSMAVLFAKSPAKLEIVNDLNRHVTNVGWCLQHGNARRDLLKMLRQIVPSEEHFRECAELYNQRDIVASLVDPDPDSAAVALSTWWLGWNGFAGTDRKPGYAVRYDTSGGHPLTRWHSFLRSISRMAERLRHTIILNRDATEVITGCPDKSSHTIYADPPYIRKSCDYEHDFAGLTEQDGNSLFGQDERLTHEGLAKLLNRFEHTRVVVSYYDEPELDWLYPAPRWRKVKLTGKKAMANANGGEQVESPEVLLINQPE